MFYLTSYKNLLKIEFYFNCFQFLISTNFTLCTSTTNNKTPSCKWFSFQNDSYNHELSVCISNEYYQTPHFMVKFN